MRLKHPFRFWDYLASLKILPLSMTSREDHLAAVYLSSLDLTFWKRGGGTSDIGGSILGH